MLHFKMTAYTGLKHARRNIRLLFLHPQFNQIESIDRSIIRFRAGAKLKGSRARHHTSEMIMVDTQMTACTQLEIGAHGRPWT